VDVGTGSGCLAVTLALECPAARVIATEVSEAALAVARDNARRLGAERIEFKHGSLFSGVAAPVDLVVSNPPYVAYAERASLPVDVVGYEPAGALFGGEDGLDVIRALVPAAGAALRPGGWLILELGLGQADAVERLIQATDALAVVRLRSDLQHILRVVVARRGARSL
jgi:release factor glutamine methyltransferase